MKKKTLAELQNEREELKKQQNKIETEIDKIVRTVSMQEYKRRYENTYWKAVNNEGRQKAWYRFYHVKTVKDIWEMNGSINCLLICDTFELRPDRFIFCNLDETYYLANLEIKITASEYNKAKSAMLKKLSEI